ncbi:MAG: TIGR00730 family Rossman fold protein [Phycisphaerales bacterium]|nr:TIGR00730 family Rossman fold protein [Planctomycetota bacterium]MCH8507765.1 TIGR00730 family Rossman fold protein [Phycisphaerales bacterium]
MSDPNGGRFVAVFCGARTGLDPAYAEAARTVGRLIGERGLGLVFGGGRVGLMGVVADAALEAGAPVVGVIPRSMVDKELAHTGCTELHIISTMHERKAMMAERASAFLALPGGVGTLDEVFEAITWNQLAIHDKAIGFLDTDGFYQGLRTWLNHAADKGLVPQSTMDRLVFDPDPAAMLDRLAATDDLKVHR